MAELGEVGRYSEYVAAVYGVALVVYGGALLRWLGQKRRAIRQWKGMKQNGERGVQ
ncbi:MAG: hypothetical protein HQL53_01675 [Magnetococcales bacterium]|nr:hypothetical protein [Magnetococcales bacterium]